MPPRRRGPPRGRQADQDAESNVEENHNPPPPPPPPPPQDAQDAAGIPEAEAPPPPPQAQQQANQPEIQTILQALMVQMTQIQQVMTQLVPINHNGNIPGANNQQPMPQQNQAAQPDQNQAQEAQQQQPQPQVNQEEMIQPQQQPHEQGQGNNALPEKPPAWYENVMTMLKQHDKELREQKGEIVQTGPRPDELPFTKEVIAAQAPPNHHTANYHTYDGSTDPDDHIKYYNRATLAVNLNDGVKCKLFASTLKDVASDWFDSLPQGTIPDFRTLSEKFTTYFATMRKERKTTQDLQMVKQEEGERLSSFIRRFIYSSLQVRDILQDTAIHILTQNTVHEEFRQNLITHKPKDLNEAKSRAQKFVLASDIYRPRTDQLALMARPDARPGKKARTEPSYRHEQPYRPEPAYRMEPTYRAEPQPLQTLRPNRYESHHKFNTNIGDILMCIREKIDLRYPQRLKSDPRMRDQSKYCHFHRDHGHLTDDCGQLKAELDYLANRGELNSFLLKPDRRHEKPRFDPPGNRSYQTHQRGHNPSTNKGQQGKKPQNQNAARTDQMHPDQREQGPQQNLPPAPQRQENHIYMITGGLVAGGSDPRQRNAYVNECLLTSTAWPEAEVPRWKKAPIYFDEADKATIRDGHCDPFVTTLKVGSYRVDRIFVDTGSGPDIMYRDMFDKMGLDEKNLVPYSEKIYGFDGSAVPVQGIVSLPVIFGSGDCTVNYIVQFMVVNILSRYNAVLGRKTLCMIGAIVSQPHLCMKFPTPRGIGVVHVNQKMARECYALEYREVEREGKPSEGIPRRYKRRANRKLRKEASKGRKTTESGQETEMEESLGQEECMQEDQKESMPPGQNNQRKDGWLWPASC